MLFDAHSHVHFKKNFPDVEEAILRAESAGVTGQILVGCTVKDFYDVLKFVKNHSDHNFWAVIGVHPHDSNQLTKDVLSTFRDLVKKENGSNETADSQKTIVAIGEIGLDYNRNFQSEDIQKNAFTAQLELALELDLPVVIHERDAWEDTLAILDKVGNKKVVLHSFTGGLPEAKQCMERGFYISFSGMLSYPKNEHLRDVAGMVDLDKFMVETDCPYLPPQIYRGKRNEPAYVVETAKEFAKVRKLDFQKVCDLTTANVKSFFNIKSNLF